MNWRTTLGGLLLVGALISGWSAWNQRSKPSRNPSDEASVDYIARDFEIVSLDKQGKEAMTLRAPQMERSRADQTMSIVTPLFLLPDANGQHWEMRSKTGWVSANGDELRLRDDVAGDSPKVPSIPPTTFRTQSLDVFPQTNSARTADPVTMTRPGMMQTGVGFQVDLKSRQYKLLSQVKARYEPNAAR